jgi:hypothetical protein
VKGIAVYEPHLKESDGRRQAPCNETKRLKRRIPRAGVSGTMIAGLTANRGVDYWLA